LFFAHDTFFFFRTEILPDENAVHAFSDCDSCEASDFTENASAARTLQGAFKKIAASSPRSGFEGYPPSTSKKKRVCVVTYRHSDSGLFENSLPL
jgi:hypothetical protein